MGEKARFCGEEESNDGFPALCSHDCEEAEGGCGSQGHQSCQEGMSSRRILEEVGSWSGARAGSFTPRLLCCAARCRRKTTIRFLLVDSLVMCYFIQPSVHHDHHICDPRAAVASVQRRVGKSNISQLRRTGEPARLLLSLLSDKCAMHEFYSKRIRIRRKNFMLANNKIVRPLARSR